MHAPNLHLMFLVLLWSIMVLTNSWKFKSPILPPTVKIEKKCIKSISSMVGILVSIIGNVPDIHLPEGRITFINSAKADEVRMGALADVGIKEFLVKDGRQFLRLSIPLAENGKFIIKNSQTSKKSPSLAIYEAAELLELARLRFEQVGVTNPSAWGSALNDVNSALSIIKSNKEYLLSPSAQCAEIFESQLLVHLTQLADALRAKSVDRALASQEEAASALAALRLAQLPPHKLPFEVPEEYQTLPRLNGRATVEMKISSKTGFRLPDGQSVVPTAMLQLQLDGYHAPLTAGNFLALVKDGYYDNMPFQKVQELFVQTGTSPDQKKKPARTVPLELFYKTDSEPTYGSTSDDDMRATDAPILPFQAFGALGMARDNEVADSADTQFFFLKWKQALIAPGRNTLDGFYSCFGYVTDNEQLLSQVNADTDRIVYAKIVSGLDNLQLKP